VRAGGQKSGEVGFTVSVSFIAKSRLGGNNILCDGQHNKLDPQREVYAINVPL